MTKVKPPQPWKRSLVTKKPPVKIFNSHRLHLWNSCTKMHTNGHQDSGKSFWPIEQHVIMSTCSSDAPQPHPTPGRKITTHPASSSSSSLHAMRIWNENIHGTMYHPDLFFVLFSFVFAFFHFSADHLTTSFWTKCSDFCSVQVVIIRTQTISKKKIPGKKLSQKAKKFYSPGDSTHKETWASVGWICWPVWWQPICPTSECDTAVPVHGTEKKKTTTSVFTTKIRDKMNNTNTWYVDDTRRRGTELLTIPQSFPTDQTPTHTADSYWWKQIYHWKVPFGNDPKPTVIFGGTHICKKAVL